MQDNDNGLEKKDKVKVHTSKNEEENAKGFVYLRSQHIKR
jgi:hypothetical protein